MFTTVKEKICPHRMITQPIIKQQSVFTLLCVTLMTLDASIKRLNVFRSMIWIQSAARKDKVAEASAGLCPWKSTACRGSSMCTSPTRSTTGGWRSSRVLTWGTWPSWRGCTSARAERGTERKMMMDVWEEDRTERPDCQSGWICPMIP